jgi:enterochelin esterase-like enzyme
VIEKQAFRFVLRALACLVGMLALAGCQASISIAQLPAQSIVVTRTPFQAQSPTSRPSSTLTPTAVPSPTLPPNPTPLPCLGRPGQVESHTVEFSNPAAPLTFRVYLPPCYGVEEGYRYPVLYMIHGQTFSDDQWDRLGLDEAADEMINNKVAPPFLIVMPREANTFEDIFTASFPTDLVDGLVPWIDANYSTCAERDCRAIGGLSRGGAWAFRLGLIHWEVFGAIGLHSTPPFIGDPNRFPGWLNQIPAGQAPRIYMDTGKQDWYINSTTQLEQLFLQYGVPHEWYLFNGTHNEDYWSAHVADYLAWYTQSWK